MTRFSPADCYEIFVGFVGSVTVAEFLNYSFNIKKFRPTNRQNPCPVCGDTSGKCRTANDDLILCMTHDHGVPGWHYLGQTKDFLWGKFVPGSDNTARDAVQVYCDEQWPWDEPCTDEIREALVMYVESEING